MVHDIEAIADIIVDSVRPNLESKRFPEDFFSEDEKYIFISLPQKGSLTVTCNPMLTEASLKIKDTVSGKLLLHNDYNAEVADIILKSIMMGRREFKIPTDSKTTNAVLDEFINWFPKILELINYGCMNSSVGTKYEEVVFKTVMKKLSFHPAIKCAAVFGEYVID